MDDGAFRERYGPVALVTGASSGIGRCFATMLAAMGIDLVLVARRVERLEALAADLAARHGITAHVHAIDLAVPAAAQAMLDATASLDVGLVVSNAGFGLKGAHAANDPAAMAEMVAVNCTVPMLLSHGFIPRLKARGQGGIILTSSVEGLIGCPYSAAYSASKAFVNALGEGLWGELTPAGIDVLVLCPGATDTEAAGLQGIDIKAMPNVMAPDDVARLTLAHIQDGPVYLPSTHYQGVFDHLRALPRREALTAMAASMKR